MKKRDVFKPIYKKKDYTVTNWDKYLTEPSISANIPYLERIRPEYKGTTENERKNIKSQVSKRIERLIKRNGPIENKEQLIDKSAEEQEEAKNQRSKIHPTTPAPSPVNVPFTNGEVKTFSGNFGDYIN